MRLCICVKDYIKFPIAFLPYHRRVEHAFQLKPQLDQPGNNLLVTASRCASSLTTPPRPTWPLPTSNCGFTKDDDAGYRASERRKAHQCQRNKRHIDDGQINRLREPLSVNIPNVGPLEQDNA